MRQPDKHGWNNIREATYQQNAHNRQSSGRWNNSDLAMEMCVTKSDSGRFRVRVRGVSCGTYDTLEEANKMAREARRKLYGEFAHGTS